MVFVSIVCFILLGVVAGIYDPANIFCGSLNCYDVLSVSRTASTKEIQKAYRKLSLTLHPDKNKAENATEVFRIISKANEVLSGNESRKLFDYYLDHPRDYFTVSGQHYLRELPKSNVWIILLVLAIFISWLTYTVQYQRWERVVKYIKIATKNNLSLKDGGSKQTMKLFERAKELYDIKVKEARAAGDKNAGRSGMMKDPLFESIVDKLVAELKIEGGYKKPELRDLFLVQLLLSPYSFSVWARKYYRRKFSTVPFTHEEKTELAREACGLGTWDEMDEETRAKLIAAEIWKPEVREKLFGSSQPDVEGADEGELDNLNGSDRDDNNNDGSEDDVDGVSQQKQSRRKALARKIANKKKKRSGKQD